MSSAWQPGYIPHGWTRGERVRLVPPLGRFRGFVHIEQDEHGFPIVARARTVAMEIEFSGADRWMVDNWLLWWRASSDDEFFEAEAAPAPALQPEGIE